MTDARASDDETLWIQAAIQRGLHRLYNGELKQAWILLKEARKKADASDDAAIAFAATIHLTARGESQ